MPKLNINQAWDKSKKMRSFHPQPLELHQRWGIQILSGDEFNFLSNEYAVGLTIFYSYVSEELKIGGYDEDRLMDLAITRFLKEHGEESEAITWGNQKIRFRVKPFGGLL